MKKSRSHFYATAFSFVLLTSFHAHGALVRFDFTGVVVGSEIIEGTDQGLTLPGAPSSGSLIEGYYIFDTETPDTYAFPDPSPQYGLYLDSIKQLYVTFGGLGYSFDLQLAGKSDIRTENAVGINVRDRYYASLVQGSGEELLGDYIVGPAIADYLTSSFVLNVFDWEGGLDPDLLADDSLPSVPPDLSLATDFLNLGDATLMSILMQYEHPASHDRAQLRGQLTSLSLHAVPIPPALWLFGSGLLGLIGISRRKKQS